MDKITTTVVLTFSKPVFEGQLREVEANILRALVEERNNGYGLTPLDSEVATLKIQVGELVSECD